MTFLAGALPKLTEKRLMAQIVTLAEMLGWTVRHDRATNASGRCQECGAVRKLPRNDAGMVDLLLIRRPRIIWAEVKGPRTRTTPAQLAMIVELRDCGQECYIWREEDFPKIERILR